MPKAFDDGVTTHAESNFNKLLVGDGTVGDGNGVFCFGASVYWVSGTTFAVNDGVGATNIYAEMTATWDAVNKWVAVDFSALTNLIKTPTYAPVVFAQQETTTTPYHIQVSAAASGAAFQFFSMGATPAVIATADTHMNFHFLVWGYLKA